MASWQRRARLLIALGGGGFAIVVALAFQQRTPQRPPIVIERTDPKAVVESAGGRTIRLTADKEDVRIEFDTLLTYPDGSTRMRGLTVTAKRDSGRVYTIRGQLGQVDEHESNISLEGAVTLDVDDGLRVSADRASYLKQEGLLLAPGPAEFSRGRLTGSGVGLRYEENADVLTLLDQAVVRLAAGDGEAGLHVTAGSAEFRRPEHLLRFDRTFHAVRGSSTMDADHATARLDDADSRLQAAELRGNARLVEKPERPGSVERMSARDIDLQYALDGRTLERARLAESAAIQVSAATAAASRRIAAGTIEVSLADGSTPTALTAEERVELDMPAGADGPARTIQAQSLVGKGDADRGLRSARFAGDVRFRERGSAGERVARAGALEASLGSGLTTIEEAHFQQNVRFNDAGLAATAASARYRLNNGTLELGGTEPGRERPHLSHERVDVHAAAMTVTLEGPEVDASDDVKSVLHPHRDGESEKVVVPSLLEADQAVQVTAARLRYSGRDKQAVYTGRAWLWQGDTSVKADTITVDDRAGDMSADGSVVTTAVFEHTGSDGRPERVRTTTTAKSFDYLEQERRATYTGEAHMNGIQGDVTAGKIELFLKPSGDALERAEAYDSVTLREKTRKTSGERMTYFGSEERYVMTGTPVTIEDECGRETTGRTLTFFRTADRIVVDGSELFRTQSKGGAKCSGAD
jgi:lipopolysaccharide transport protein LptA